MMSEIAAADAGGAQQGSVILMHFATELGVSDPALPEKMLFLVPWMLPQETWLLQPSKNVLCS